MISKNISKLCFNVYTSSKFHWKFHKVLLQAGSSIVNQADYNLTHIMLLCRCAYNTDLPPWRVVPMFYANWKPKVTLKFANGQPYLEETPTLQCNTQSRAILEDYFSDTKGDLNKNRGEEKDGTPKQDVQNVDRTQPGSTREQDLKLQQPKKNTAVTAATPDVEFNPYDPDVFGPDCSNRKELIDPKQQRLIVDKAFEQLSKDHTDSSKLEAVAIIGSSETSRRYCRRYLSMVDDLEEIWRNLERGNNDTGSNGDSCTTSSVHIILEESTCRCIFVVQLHPADTHATHQRLLRKVMLGCQSINILYGPAEVREKDWLVTPFLDFGRTARMITADNKYSQGQCPEACKVQQNILATLREVLGVFPICPFYANVKVPLLLLWQSVFQNTWKKSTSNDRVKTIFKIFDIQRGPHASNLEFKTEADNIYRSQQQLPLVAVDSGNMSCCHPHELCKAVQTPRNLWLQDMTEDSPITLLASTNKSVLVQIAQDASQGAMGKDSVKKCNVCTAFPASLDTQADQMSSKMIDCFWRIEPLNQLNSLKTWNCPVLVITCISETRAQAFNCLNYIAGGSYPTEEDIIMKATDDEGVQHPISRLMACTRYAEGRLYVMLALPGITAGTFCSTSGLEEGQRNLVLSAISLSNIFVLDTSACPKETIKGFTKAVHELLVMSQLVDGLQINRAKVDENLFCGNLAVLSTSSLNKECLDQNIHIDDVSCEKVLLAAFPKGIAWHVYTQRRRSAATAAPHRCSAATAAPHRCSAATAAPHRRSAATAAPHRRSAATAAPRGRSAAKAAPRGRSAAKAAPHGRSAAKAAPRNAEKVDAMSSEPEGYEQGRSVVHLLSDLQNKSSFPKGQLFVRTLNLVLALASTDFSLANMQPVADIYRSHTLQLEENLRKVLVYGDNDQKRGSEQLIQHIYRKETGKFTVSDVILDNGESTVNLIQEIRNGLISKFGQESTICAIFNIKTHVQSCLQKLVDHRCEDAGRYLDGQIETGDYVDVDKGDFQKIIETFRKRWTLCGVRNASKRCTKCHYCCLLVDGHATSDLPHNCLDSNDKHLCVKQCELEVRSGTNLNKCFRKCAEQAGHYEVDSTDIERLHKCEKIGEQDVHMCRKPCDFRESPSCDESGVCVQFIGHSDDKNCRCSKSPDEHRCPQVCVLAGNPICQKDELPMGYSAASEFDSTGTQGSAKEREHPLCSKALMPKGHTHLCGFDHHCTSLCENNDGVCMLSREDDVVPAGAQHESGQDGYRLVCSLRIASDRTTHDRFHTCGKEHRCDVRCPLCDCHCTEKYGHDGLHTMEEHGLAINSSHLLVLEGEELKPISDSTSFTCHDICLKAGRGHVHLTPKTSHWSTGSEMRENHDEFWARFGFSKPCSDPKFMMCAAKCHDDSHNDEHAVFCLRDVLHRPITDVIPAGGYVSLERDANSGTLPGHHFKCEPSSHRCYSPCKQESYGERCSSRCEKNLSHTGDDCNCGKFHSCGNACPVSKSSRDMVYKCSNVCEKSSEEEHPDCFCEDDICHVTCNIQGCMKPCGLHHTHDGNEHDCKGDHMCIGLCEENGRCSTDTHVGDSDEHSQPRAEASSHLNTSTSCASKEKTSCGITLKNPLRSHSGPHKCSGKHFCRDQCKSCSQYCNLDPNHSGQRHETQHGRILDKQHLLVFKADRTLMRIQDSTTCSSLCSDAGSGHVHVLSMCSSRYDCRSSTDEIIRHVTIPGRNNRQHVHVTTHVNFWTERNFQDPCEEKLIQGVFQRCPEIFQTSLQPGATFQCVGNLWHVSFDKRPTGSLHSARDLWTFASQKVVYHYFEGCRQDCTEFCSILDYGAKCTARCVEEAGHKCSKFCKRECRGQGDPIYKHIAGQVVHTCGKKHHCKEMCQDRVGVCFRKAVNGEDPPPHSTRLDDGNAYKLPCSEAIPVGYSDHDHVVNHHRCGYQHTCEKFCRLCGQYCSLLQKHSGLCKTDHGAVIKSQLESLKVWTVDDTAVSWEDCDGMTCAELCNRAGPSHSHETKCKCSWRTEAKFHRHRSSAFLASSIDDISHDFFWNNELGFEDPTPDEKQRIAFSRCPARCTNPKEEHEDTDEDKLYCTEGLFHPKLIPSDYRDKPGYCSPCEPYHHFACKQHMCSSSCMLYDNGKRCTDRCKLNANHSASGLDCVCEKVKHICGVECQNRFCRMLCQEDWSPKDNHTHWCHSNDNCSGTCEFENCKRECDLGHLHSSKCNCRKAHRCPGKCQKDGLCSITFSTESGLELPRETHGDCEVAILPGRDSHSGECDCKKKHTCLKQCALCKQFCTLGHHHYKQKHQTKHSLIVNVRDWTMLGADESAVSVPDDVTCSELCTTADIGHTHILDHDSLHQVCSNDRRKCRPLNEKTSHHATHVHFWASLGFVDPSEESVKEKFRRCNVVCDRHSPSNSSPVYCTGEQWHDSYRGETVTQFTTGYVGNIQDTPSFGHHFKCSNHLCEEPCDLVHPGGVGEGSDHKCGLPLGHDCTDSCKLSCKGHRSAGHCSGSSTHCCDTAHKCQEMCEGSDGHCKPVAESGYTGTLRLACAKEIPALKWRHGGIHHHKRDVFSRPANDGEHFCTVTCPRCHMTCQKRFNHDGNHRTTHGAVINRSATEINMALVDPWKTVSPCREDFSFQTASAKCSAMCQLAGPGHLHVFGEVSIEESQQLQEMSHVEFWKKVKFDDPYDNEDAAQFNKCSKPCTYPGHGQERILCERELFHEVLFMGEVPVDSHLSEDGCLLKCKHPCENGCAFQDLSRSCVGKCKLGYGHSGEHICEAPRHICKSTCDKCESGCVAVLDNPSTPHDVHKCDEHKPCGEQCGFVYDGQKGILCTKRCTKPSRHALDPVQWKHSCQSKHSCAEFCNHEGRCPPDGFAAVASGQQLQNAEGFAATAGQQQLNAEGRRMCCDTAFHSTNHDCGCSHLCSTQCPQCGVFCSLVYHRTGVHSIAHGTVAAGTRVNVVNSQGSVLIQRDIACHEVCELAGRSHYHVVKCPYDCTGDTYCKAEVEWHRREKHQVTHREFWKRQKINDPCFQVTTQKTLEEFGLCINLCHQSCFSKCSLPAMHNIKAAPDDVHKLNNHYYPRCRQLCKGYCKAHRVMCTRPAGHDTDHACQRDARSVSSGGATSSVSRLQGPKCTEKCPICSVECSLPSPHDSPHDCVHGYVPDDVCRNSICQMSRTPQILNAKGETCSTMCVDKKDRHRHVFQHQTSSAQKLPSGIEYQYWIRRYVCSHDRFWQVHNFKNPSQL